jgi:hypothetical protein
MRTDHKVAVPSRTQALGVVELDLFEMHIERIEAGVVVDDRESDEGCQVVERRRVGVRRVRVRNRSDVADRGRRTGAVQRLIRLERKLGEIVRAR